MEDEKGGQRVSVVPVTHTERENPEDAIEIPQATMDRLGLDAERSWIVIAEINMFISRRPDLRSVPGSNPPNFDYGFLPPKLFRAMRDKMALRIRANLAHAVGRTE